MDVVCLRVIAPESPETRASAAGRLDNIAAAWPWSAATR